MRYKVLCKGTAVLYKVDGGNYGDCLQSFCEFEFLFDGCVL